MTIIYSRTFSISCWNVFEGANPPVEPCQWSESYFKTAPTRSTVNVVSSADRKVRKRYTLEFGYYDTIVEDLKSSIEDI